MGATWSSCLLGTALGLCLTGPLARADDPPVTNPPPDVVTPLPIVLPPLPPYVAPAGAAASHEAAPVAVEVDPAFERNSAQDRLKNLPDDKDKEATTATRAFRAILSERLDWLDQWDRAVKERTDAENPRPTPEQQAREWKADLERIKATLAQTASDADALVPAAFRDPSAAVSEKVQNEMKEAIETARTDLKDWTTKLEQFRAAPSRKGNAALAAIRAARDEAHQRVAGLKARSAEREAAVAGAKSPEARALAHERLVNFQWQARVEAERLKGLEARHSLETKRSELAVLNAQVLEAHVQLAQQTLDSLKTRYRAITALQQRDLLEAAATEKGRARSGDDPLEKFRAQRTAELLELEARVIKTESAQATGSPPTLEQQRSLADQAETDLTNVRKMLEDGRISHLEALRLNNDFRRIGAERSQIVHNELAIAAGRLASAESALSDIEVELIYDARDDRFELDRLLEKVPGALQPKAAALFDEVEHKHVELLTRRRVALEKLARRAEETHEQILRRLRILDDHFGFIRTNLFWVRDAEPLGLATIAQVQHETWQLARAGSRITEQLLDPKAWGGFSPEFLSAAFGLVLLPWPLLKVRRGLRSLEPRRGVKGRPA